MKKLVINKIKIKYIIFLFVFVCMSIKLNNAVFADEINYIKMERKMTMENEYYIDLEKQPRNIYKSNLVVIGDSYSVIDYLFSGYNFNIIAHHGFSMEMINQEFIGKLNANDFKYAFVFVGPNDFMKQTDLDIFRIECEDVANRLYKLNIVPIITNYYDPIYALEPSFDGLEIKCNQYAEIFYDTFLNHGGRLFDSSDIYKNFGSDQHDAVHPSILMYRPLMERLLSFIDEIENEVKYD